MRYGTKTLMTFWVGSLIGVIGLLGVWGHYPTASGVVRYVCTDTCCSMCREVGTSEHMKDCLSLMEAKGYDTCRLRVWQQFTVYPQDMQSVIVPIAECFDGTEQENMWYQSHRLGNVFAFLVDLNKNRYPEDAYLPHRQIEGYAMIYNLKPDPWWNRYLYLGRIVGANTTQIGFPKANILPAAFNTYSVPMDQMTGAKDGVWAVPVEASSHSAAFAMIGINMRNPQDLCEHNYDYPVLDGDEKAYRTKGKPTEGWKYDADSYIHVMASSVMDLPTLKKQFLEPQAVVEQILNEHGIPIPE